jgi:hypothetical protein
MEGGEDENGTADVSVLAARNKERRRKMGRKIR